MWIYHNTYYLLIKYVIRIYGRLGFLATFGFVQQKIYGIWQIVLKMKVLAMNKISRNLKMKNFKMPNAAYSNR